MHQQIVYTSLSPGDYNLLVREVGGGKQIALHISVRPPFYASPYAFAVYGLLSLLFLVWLIRFNRSRAFLKASLEMEHREKLRIERLNQMKLKFYINISHELRTPLTLMISQVICCCRTMIWGYVQDQTFESAPIYGTDAAVDYRGARFPPPGTG